MKENITLLDLQIKKEPKKFDYIQQIFPTYFNFNTRIH